MALKSKVLNTALTIMFIVFPGRGAAVKRSTGAKYSIPGKGRLFFGCMGIKFRLMNVLEWGFNYELHFQNNGNNERIQQ
jgi:hypothetical protein